MRVLWRPLVWLALLAALGGLIYLCWLYPLVRIVLLMLAILVA